MVSTRVETEAPVEPPARPVLVMRVELLVAHRVGAAWAAASTFVAVLAPLDASRAGCRSRGQARAGESAAAPALAWVPLISPAVET